MPRWSKPHIITGKSLNSYSISTLLGTAIPGLFHSRRLRSYIPLRGSNLDLVQMDHTDPNTHTHNNNDLDEAEERMADEMDSLLNPMTDPREPLDRDAD
jgi:hypothetical protein